MMTLSCLDRHAVNLYMGGEMWKGVTAMGHGTNPK